MVKSYVDTSIDDTGDATTDENSKKFKIHSSYFATAFEAAHIRTVRVRHLKPKADGIIHMMNYLAWRS